MKVKFLGAAGTVTGSCYLLTSESGKSILIDCGMFQGTPELERLNYSHLACDCSMLSGMILTHAHLDHCGRLPILLPEGFSREIWMTAPTRDLTELALYDSAKISKEDHRDNPLYVKSTVEETIAKFRVVEYEKSFSVSCFSITMRDAGHILGSGSLEIIDQSASGEFKKIVFSGDLGKTPEDLIRPTELIPDGDVVVMESTYGDKTHPAGDPSASLQLEINAVEASGGTLLIPAFSIQRSQEILHRISHLKKDGKIRIETPVFLDSPMAQKATFIFEKYRPFFNEEFQKEFNGGRPFDFPRLTIVESRQDGKLIDKTSGPKVIIAGSGMMTGGRILDHARHYLPRRDTRLLIVGFQAEETLGRAIANGQKSVLIENFPVKVEATVTQLQTMSSHADQPRLLNWLKNISGVKQVFLSHGEDGPRSVLAEKIKQDLEINNIAKPTLNQDFDLTRQIQT